MHLQDATRKRPSSAALAKAWSRGYVDKLRTATAQAGRDPASLLVYGQALIVTGESSQQARDRHAEYLEHVDIEAALALLSGWTGVDFSRVPLDATIDYIESDAGRSALASFSSADPGRQWTVRDAARFIGLGGRGPVLAGDAGEVADQLEDWVDSTGIDGFNLAFAVAHESMRDVVDYIVPELQRRGRYRTSYPSGTLRHKLAGHGPRLASSHPGTQVAIPSRLPEEA